MTCYLRKRCRHCQSVYDFQASGHGCFDQPNDDRYCPSCQSIIIDALSHVRQKFESTWVECDIPIEDVMAEEKRLHDEAEKSGRIWAKCFSPGLYDMTDGQNHNVTGIVKMNGKTYMYSRWTKKDTGEFKPKVSVLMQRDMLTGALSDWQD